MSDVHDTEPQLNEKYEFENNKLDEDRRQSRNSMNGGVEPYPDEQNSGFKQNFGNRRFLNEDRLSYQTLMTNQIFQSKFFYNSQVDVSEEPEHTHAEQELLYPRNSNAMQPTNKKEALTKKTKTLKKPKEFRKDRGSQITLSERMKLNNKLFDQAEHFEHLREDG